jgi:hypothetical protein
VVLGYATRMAFSFFVVALLIFDFGAISDQQW